jgi:hypothetical protein
MSHTLTIRLSDELLAWLVAKGEIRPYTGVPLGSRAREPLESAKSRGGKQRLLRHAGVICGGPAELSSRKGFSRSRRESRIGASGLPWREATTSMIARSFDVAKGITEPLLTCEAVLAEAAFHVESTLTCQP